MPWYSSTSCTVMPIGAPPRHTATRNVGRKPLRTIRRASSMESRNSDSAEMKTFSIVASGGGRGLFLQHVLSGRVGDRRVAGRRAADGGRRHKIVSGML